jgi:hypothetical protein
MNSLRENVASYSRSWNKIKLNMNSELTTTMNMTPVPGSCIRSISLWQWWSWIVPAITTDSRVAHRPVRFPSSSSCSCNIIILWVWWEVSSRIAQDSWTLAILFIDLNQWFSVGVIYLPSKHSVMSGTFLMVITKGGREYYWHLMCRSLGCC